MSNLFTAVSIKEQEIVAGGYGNSYGEDTGTGSSLVDKIYTEYAFKNAVLNADVFSGPGGSRVLQNFELVDLYTEASKKFKAFQY
ncbi:hypothetical protein H6G54_14745 [Anabaena cylindrica FACHB-243]|uniref:Uncharacterized protein n=1 Tax=Anabaena cylindrica (strain ATCC 27899 / PCC 7122) TaxID=272123 RepID=K9ZM84_ANACC|nr:MULTISPECIES: CTB family bacteriocin [Anabaena]AFZ60338.1 hypothetical protein Anacy_4998 [Anabaena cylindrica PCC 7122]MBD2418936.1 hypothetical protein [Anabaena cylindrica FACHB-243]MBY5285055.1 hypothetical protein [Anabaena sp. CCAP 1446/1C]MBY5310901.1 hypothetical protein [Anabaena sp. CCAP 1446/1C]MCM2404527.1 CTB family bacteriocin [Anabaena sp. CCAP 1446/1C]